MYPRISINIVTWNSMRFLPDLLESIFAQTYQDFNVLIIDNASNDGIEAFLDEHYPEVTMIRNPRNLGFTGAHNQGVRYALEHWNPSDYLDRFVLATNPDIIMEPDFLEKIMKGAARHPEAGMLGGKLRRAFGEQVDDEVFQEVIKSDRIDTTGLRAHKNRTVTDRGAGEMDTGQYDEEMPLFGISGALALYRAQALFECAYEGEYFDNDFFAYKEDVDLAWRLQRLGWDAWYVPDAVAFHYRGVYGKERASIWEKIKGRRGQSALRRYYSTRNQWFLLQKHVSFWSHPIAFFRVWIRESARCAYVLLFEPVSRPAITEALKGLVRMRKKRIHLATQSKRSHRDLRHWFM